MTTAIGKSAMILAQTKEAIVLAKGCPYGLRLVEKFTSAQELKGLRFKISRRACREQWFLLLLVAGVLKPEDNMGRFIVELSIPLHMALSAGANKG